MAEEFLGLSVVDVAQSVDFGNGELSLSINLVACTGSATEAGQTFTPVPIGTPVSFTYGNTFYGILDRYVREKTPEERYSVNITNGASILDGTKLILNDYLGATNSVSNLLNIYGTLGFQNTNIGENGIYWRAIRDTAVNLTAIPSGTQYGGPITFLGRNYGLDLSELPNTVPSGYTINQDSISVTEFISEICDIGGHEYYIEMVDPSNATVPPLASGYDGIFVARTIDRTGPTDVNALVDFIDSQTGCIVSKSTGVELRKGIHAKFILGANVEQMYFNTVQNLDDNNIGNSGTTKAQYTNDTVLPYFGVDADNSAIIGETYAGDDEYYFDIDVRDIQHPAIGSTYTTSTGEIRAAKRGREAWQRFLDERNANQYIIDRTVTGSTDPNVDWEPFEVPVISGSLSNLSALGMPVPRWMFTGYSNAQEGYQGIGIPKFGYAYTRAQGSQTTPVISADVQYPSGVQRGYVGDFAVGNAKLLHYPKVSGVLNPYFGIASKLRVISGHHWQFARNFEYDLYPRSQAGTPANQAFFNRAFEEYKTTRGGGDAVIQSKIYSSVQPGSTLYDAFADTTIEKATELYNKIKDLGDQYYNRKFMVSIPDVLAKYDSQSDQVILSHETSNTGYMDESSWVTAYQQGIIPSISGINKLTDQNNKFYPYVKYENAYAVDPSGLVQNARYDLSEIPYQNKIMEFTNSKLLTSDVTFPDGTVFASGDPVNIVDVWVKCSVQENIVFEDDILKTGPRAIIELPGVAALPSQYDTTSIKGKKALFSMMAREASRFAFNHAGLTPNPVNTAIAVAARSLDNVGSDEALFDDGEDITFADLYAIPLRSKILSYGPWSAAASGVDIITGAFPIGGTVEYVRNEELAPWNYGGYTNMNIAGQAEAYNAVTSQAYDGSGSIEILGPPISGLTIGSQIGTNAPHITSINIRFGEKGTVTTYNFQAWSDHRSMGGLKNYYLKKFNDSSRDFRDLKRNYRTGVQNGLWNSPNGMNQTIGGRGLDVNKYVRRDQSNTSARVMVGQNNGFTSTVVVQPSYNTEGQAFDDYDKKAITSLDALFTPYATVDTSGNTNMPVMTYVLPTATGVISPTSSELFPWGSGNPTHILSMGEHMSYSSMGHGSREMHMPEALSGQPPVVRAMGLKGPLWVTGWGFDTAGNPVPNEIPTASGAPNGNFDPEYLWNSRKWKSGPVDLRWSESRGVWEAGRTEGGFITFVPIEVCDGIGFMCDCVNARVISTSCNSIYGSGDIVRVWDPNNCFFNMPEALLIRTVFFGHHMEYNPTPEFNEGNADCSFIVTGLCCAEPQNLGV